MELRTAVDRRGRFGRPSVDQPRTKVAPVRLSRRLDPTLHLPFPVVPLAPSRLVTIVSHDRANAKASAPLAGPTE
jgi:hypothetical protein